MPRDGKKPLWNNTTNNCNIDLKCGSMGKESIAVQEVLGSNLSGVLFHTIIYWVGIVLFE